MYIYIDGYGIMRTILLNATTNLYDIRIYSLNTFLSSEIDAWSANNSSSDK